MNGVLRLDQATIVLVEDDPDSRESLTLLLEAEGAQVCAVADAEEGVEAAMRLLPDAVVCGRTPSRVWMAQSWSAAGASIPLDPTVHPMRRSAMHKAPGSLTGAGGLELKHGHPRGGLAGRRGRRELRWCS